MGSSSIGGFVPPSDCDIRIPNVHVSTSDTTNYVSGDTGRPVAFDDWYSLETDDGGKVVASICNIGIASFLCVGAGVFDCDFVGATTALGCEETSALVTMDNCVVASDPGGEEIGDASAFGLNYITFGAELTDCLLLRSGTNDARLIADISNNITIRDCIISNGNGATVSSYRIHCIQLSICQDITIDNCVMIGNVTSTSIGMLGVESCNNVDIDNIRMSLTQDYSTYSGTGIDAAFFSINTGTKGVNVTGMFPLGAGWGNDYFFNVYNAYDVNIRCVGMIDDWFDFDNNAGSFVNVQEYGSGIDLARLWTTNSTNGNYRILTSPTVGNSIVISNCSSRYDATYYLRAIDDLMVRGLHAGSGSLGSYGGIYSTNTGSYGRQIYDLFRSSSVGAIICYFLAPTKNVNNITIISGDLSFRNNGYVDLAAGDQFIVEQDYYSKGHLAFSGEYTATRGSASWGTDEWSNVTAEFQYDIGSGYNGSWLDATVSLNWTSISGTHCVAYDNESGGPFTVGEILSWGTGGTAGTGTLSVLDDQGSTGTMDFILLSGVVPVDGLTITGVLSGATCDADSDGYEHSLMVDGVRVKYRFTATGTESGVTFFATDTISTLNDQKEHYYYVDKDLVTIRITAKNVSDNSVISGARVYLIADSGGPLAEGTILFNTLTNASGYVENTEFLYTSDQPVVGWVRKSSPGDSLYKSQQMSGTISSDGLIISTYLIPDS
jgi:hypothetical protein